MASSQPQQTEFDRVLAERVANSDNYVLIVTYRATDEDQARTTAEHIGDRLGYMNDVLSAAFAPEASVVTVQEDVNEIEVPS